MKKPTEIEQIYDRLSSSYGTFEESDDEWMTNGLSSTPFKSLVSVALSTMTSSPRTVKAAVALYEKVSTFEDLAEIDDAELTELIRSVAHYNRKTRSLKAMSRMILDEHAGQIPSTREELMALPGIGRKCADIMLNFVFESPSIAVDTHVKRVVQRIGMVEPGTAEQVADALATITPPQYTAHAHEWLIQHGMQTCTAHAPRCEECPVREWCDNVHERSA